MSQPDHKLTFTCPDPEEILEAMAESALLAEAYDKIPFAVMKNDGYVKIQAKHLNTLLISAYVLMASSPQLRGHLPSSWSMAIEQLEDGYHKFDFHFPMEKKD